MKFRCYAIFIHIFYSYLLHFFSGYLYAILILVVTTTQTFTLSQYFEHMFMVGMNLRTSLISAIYRKSLRMTGTYLNTRYHLRIFQQLSHQMVPWYVA